MNQIPNSRFKFFPQLNDLDRPGWLSSANSLYPKLTDEFFATDKLQDKLLRALANERLLPIKEILESCEMFTRIRKPNRAPLMADLCCGHGLLGMLFAIFEPKVERVLLVDRDEPESRQRLLKILKSIAPWSVDKIENIQTKITPEQDWIEPGCSIMSAHACGSLSDLCIEIALRTGGHLAILPCCYPKAACRAPLALQTAMGLGQAFDIDRTYRLEAANYRVRWGAIPREITPMNRLIYARPKVDG